MRYTTRRFSLVAVAIGLAVLQFTAAGSAKAEGDNPILTQLIQQGVPLPSGNSQKVRSPSMADGLNDAQQRQAVAAVLAKKLGAPATWEQFTENAIGAPSVLLVDDASFYGTHPQTPPYRTDHSVDLWFVAYGQLATVMAPAFMKAQFNISSTDQIDNLKPADLKTHNLEPQKYPGGGEYWVHGQFKILPANFVLQLRATAHAVETSSAASGTVAAIVDARFNSDKEFPNEWRPVIRDPNGGIKMVDGKPALGDATLYVNAGGYTKITPLIGAPGALFVEYHLVYEEPHEWFNDRSLLRSKLPQKALDDVRTFRRQVEKADAANSK
jgi:hypothetical protein